MLGSGKLFYAAHYEKQKAQHTGWPAPMST